MNVSKDEKCSGWWDPETQRLDRKKEFPPKDQDIVLTSAEEKMECPKDDKAKRGGTMHPQVPRVTEYGA